MLKIFLYILSASVFAACAHVGDVAEPYPDTPDFKNKIGIISSRGIQICDMHIHARGGVTPEVAARRESATGIKSALVTNYGKDCEVDSESKLLDFLAQVKSVKIDGKHMLAGVQVNDRDWHLKMSPETRAKFDFILADALIILHADGSSTKLWEIKSVENPQKWMEIYFAHNMRILDEPVTIFANPTYLPKPLQSMYDELWTDERLEAFMSKAARKGIVLEIQAESFAQANPRFLAAAKKHKVKFSFGSDNLTGRAQNLDSWAKAVELGNLTPSDFWTPPERR